jgi:Raf kinase inhibitor-like YbhB/YbcL family protein
MSELQLVSSAFDNNELIPKKYTCEGENISPPLTISGVPEDAETLTLIVTDPDIPDEVKNSMGIEIFDHWVAFNIPAENFKGKKAQIQPGSSVGTQGVNSSGEIGYTGPCPPAQYEPTEHRYVFSLYALDDSLSVQREASKAAVMEAMKNRVIAKAELIGRYEKTDA